MIFQITNSRTNILGADHFILNVLDKEFRYPTAIAHLRDVGMDLPECGSSWDGWVRLLHIPSTIPPWFPSGLVEHAKRLCEKMGYPVSLEDQRVAPEGDVPEVQVEIPLRDYQEEAVSCAVRSGRGVLDMPPRGGKTRAACEIHRRLALPTIWIAPTDRIVNQTFDVIRGFFGEHYACHLVGSSEESNASNHRVVVCTAATAVRLSTEFFNTRKCLIVDEFHHSSAPSYKAIFDHCDHIFYRYGMTGTFFRSGDDMLAMHALLSQTIYKIDSRELMERGYLVPTFAVFVPVPTPKLRGMPSAAYQGGHGKYGIHENAIRNQLVAQVAFYLYRAGRKVLLLVGTKKQGYILRDLLLGLIAPASSGCQFGSVEFVSTDMERNRQKAILGSFEANQEVQILIGTSLLGEGVDLPNADALVYARGEQAEVTLVQAAYRVGTATPGKTNALLVDFGDRHHRKLIEHSLERLRVYYAEPTFQVSVLLDPRDFAKWFSELPKS